MKCGPNKKYADEMKEMKISSSWAFVRIPFPFLSPPSTLNLISDFLVRSSVVSPLCYTLCH